MKIFVVGLCINVLFLVLSDAVPVKVIPGERKVVKKNGTTHTISRYYVVPNDFYENNATNNNAPELKTSALRTKVRYGKRDDSADEVNLYNKGIGRQGGKVIVGKKDKDRTHESDVDASAWVSNNAPPNILDGSVRVLVEPITIKTDIIVRLNKTEGSPVGSIETISDVSDNTPGFYTKKQENLIMSLFGSEVNKKAKINIDNFWKLVKYYVATVPNQVELMSKIEKLSAFLDVYRMLHQKSKRMPIDPIIDDLLGVIKKHGSVKKTKSKPAASVNQVKVFADSGQINSNEPSNILRSDLNTSIERPDDGGLVVISDVAPDSKSDKTTDYVPNTKSKLIIKTPKIKHNKTKGLLSRNKALKNKSPNSKNETRSSTQSVVEAISEPLIIENISWKSEPWAIGDDMKNDVPLIVNARTENVLTSAIDKDTENDVPWLPMPEAMVKPDVPLSVPDTTKQEPSISPSIEYSEPLITAVVRTQNGWPWTTGEEVKYENPIIIDGKINEAPGTEPRTKYEEPLIIAENTGNDSPWITGEWVKYEDPLSANTPKEEPSIHPRTEYEKPLIMKGTSEKDLPPITGEWVKYIEPLSADDSIKLEPGTEPKAKYEEPLIIPENTEKNTPWTTGEWVEYDGPLNENDKSKEEPLIHHRAKYEKPLINKEILESDLPWTTGEWVKYDEPSSIDDSTKHAPGAEPPMVIEENTKNNLPWSLFGEPLNVGNISKENPEIGSRIKEHNPSKIMKILHEFMPSITGKEVKNDVQLGISGSHPEQLVIGSIVKPDDPSDIGEIKENNEPGLRVENMLNENLEIDSPIRENNSFSIKDSSDKDVAWILDKWVENDVPLRVDNIASKKPMIGSPINDDKSFNIEEISDNVPWYPDEWVKSFVPLKSEKKPSVYVPENELPVIGSRIKQDEPSIIKESLENDAPWIMFDSPLTIDDEALEVPKIETKIKENEPLDIEKLITQDVPSLLKPLTKEELPWHIEDRKKKELSWLIDEEAKKRLPWSINNNKIRNPYQIYTYVINPTQVSYQNPQINKIAGMNSLQYGNGDDFNDLNDFGLTTTLNKYQNFNGNQLPQSDFKSKYSTFQQPNNVGINPGYSQSLITENQSFLPVGSEAYELELIKSNPAMIQSNTVLNEPFSYESPANQNNFFTEEHVTYGIENNVPMTKKMILKDANFQSNVQSNPYGSQSNRLSGNKVSVESTVNIDVGNNHAGTQITSAQDETLRPNMPSSESGKKLIMEANVNVDIGNQQSSSQKKTQNIQLGSQSQQSQSNSQVNYNAVNSRPTMQQTSFNTGVLVPQTVSAQYQHSQPYNQIHYVNTNGVSPYINGVKPNFQQLRPQLAASYQLFSKNNLLKLNENLRLSQLNALDTHQRLALRNLRKIVTVLLTLANNFAQNGRENNWYENIFYNVQKNCHPLQPYVYALIRQRWLHELMLLLNNNHYNLHVLYNPKILAFLTAWRFPENVIGFMTTGKRIEKHVDSGISYPPNPTTPNGYSNQKYIYNEVTKNEVDTSNVVKPNAGANSLQIINDDANAVLAILQKHLRFKMNVQKQEEDAIGANKMTVLKEIVLFLKQKGYGPTIIQDLIRKVHGEVYLAESHGCHTEYQPDVVHHLYNVIFPVLRRSAQ